jgi:serine/threonine protein kinase
MKKPRFVQVEYQKNHEGQFLLMPFPKFGTFESFIKTKRPPDSLRLELLCQIAEGIDFLHSKGQLHRNIQASEFLIDWPLPVQKMKQDVDHDQPVEFVDFDDEPPVPLKKLEEVRRPVAFLLNFNGATGFLSERVER